MVESTNSLSLYVGNVAVLIHQSTARQHSLQLLLPTGVAATLTYVQSTQVLPKQKDLCLATFYLSKGLLANEKIQTAWLAACQVLPTGKATKTILKNKNSWLLSAATDGSIRQQLLAEVGKLPKYEQLLPKALPYFLQQPTIQKIQQATEFWFAAAQELLQQWQTISITAAEYEQWQKAYQESEERFDTFVAQQKEQSYYGALLILAKLIAHIEEKATAKKQWNTVPDNRTIAPTGIRQNLWIQQLLTYKKAGNNLAAITTPTIQNALLYLLHPAEQTPILSPTHQQLLAHHLLDTHYQPNTFTLQLRSFFDQFDLSVVHADNYTYLLQQFLYHKDNLPLWKYDDEDTYQAEVMHLTAAAAEPLATYEPVSTTVLPTAINQILYGPPGTGKTIESMRRAVALASPQNSQELTNLTTIQAMFEALTAAGQIVFTTFHQSMSYEDFVEGIKPILVNDQVQYEVQDGIVKQLAAQAIQHPNLSYVLIIDEINRGNTASILGELITLLEADKRLGMPHAITVQLPYSKAVWGLPPNIHIVATMNTADQNIEQLDLALRRRFSFVEIAPNAAVLPQDIEGINIALLLQTINTRITILLDRNHCIGHTYLLPVRTLIQLQAVFEHQLIPLLVQYFHGDKSKIGLVLGRAFVQLQDNARAMLADFPTTTLGHFDTTAVYHIARFPVPKEAYQSIYE